MIIKLKKFLIYGIKNQMDAFFEAAQEKGFIEFIRKSKKIKKYSNEVKNYIDAIKILKKQPKRIPVHEKVSSKLLVKKILHLNQSLENLYEEERLVNSEIMRISPFGKFSKEEILNLEKQIHRYFQFFTIKKSKREKFNIPEELIYINSAYDLDYFIAINSERKSYPKMIEIFIEQPLEILHKRKIIIEKQILQIQKKLKQLASYLKFLIKELIKELNTLHLESAKNDVYYPIEESVFAIEAWIPENKIEKLQLLTKNFDINFEEISIEKKDKVPTYLENKKNAKIGEDLVNIYDVPSTTDKDPSIWILISFAIFFAMIVSDMGYGFIFLIISLILKYKLKNPKPGIKRFTKLCLILSITCIFWGGLANSFFGVGPKLDSSLNKVALLNNLAIKKADYHLKEKDDVYEYWMEQYPEITNVKNGKELLSKCITVEDNQIKFVALDAFKNNILMEFALLIGIFHISLSLFRYISRNYAGLGWIIFIFGGYLYFPSILKATSLIYFLNIMNKSTCFFVGKIMVFVGIALAILLALVQKKIKGIIEIATMLTVFADILSYLRLYALGLAGMIMATTFNSIGISMGIVFGFLIIIAGHVVNILLTIMGGVIHGLRLNFIEWYHYSFEGDGKLFDPLRLLK